jgi:hypothetical protein
VDKTLDSERPSERFFTHSVNEFVERLRRWLIPLNLGDGSRHESIFFDDSLLTLPVDKVASLRRRLIPGVPDSHSQALYTITLPKGLRDRVAGHGEIVNLSTATRFFCRTFSNDGVSPYSLVRFRRLSYGLPEGGRITVDTDVQHFSMLQPITGDEPAMSIGLEEHPRVRVQLDRPPSRKLQEALDQLPRLPHISKRWMGYFFTERITKRALKRVNELPGFEYEIKLAAPNLDIDRACLPFPIFRVFQSQCVRRYYDGYRVSFRLARATMVQKGEVELIRGVPRRSEQKQKELSAWSLPQTELEMRRIKKTYLLLNPETQRTYNLCLDLCLHGNDQEMNQIEIEYIGTLAGPHAAFGLSTEREVIADMVLIRDRLIERHGFKVTRATKRDFARRHAHASK